MAVRVAFRNKTPHHHSLIKLAYLSRSLVACLHALSSSSPLSLQRLFKEKKNLSFFLICGIVQKSQHALLAFSAFSSKSRNAFLSLPIAQQRQSRTDLDSDATHTNEEQSMRQRW